MSSHLPQFTPPSPYPHPGEVLDDKYRIEKLLGEGGMGAVAKATHLLRRAPVALKFMSPAVLAMPGAVERFVNEGVAASQIDSDHVVKVFDVGRMPSGAPYLVMEFLDGADLSQILARNGGRVDVPRAVHFGLQILRALQMAHSSGIIHRDMKPSNCFVVEKDGEPDFVKLVDFGISKVRSDGADGRSANLTRTNSALGTPLYMSPEQARSPRDVDHRTDLYSVGAILYEMLGGRTPYTADSGEYSELLFKIFTSEPDPLRGLRPEVPEGLAAAIHRALTRDVSQRFASAVEMAEAIAPFADARSSMIVTRFQGMRARSPSGSPGPQPAAMASYVPPAPNYGEAAVANTFPGEAPPAPAKVATEVGVTREAHPSPTPSRRSKAPLVVIVVAATALAVGGTLVMVLHRSTGGGASVTQEPMVGAQPPGAPPAPPSATAPPSPSVAAIAPIPPPPAASLSPLPTGTATVTQGAPPPKPPPGASSPTNPASPPPGTPANKPPQTLGGIQLH